MFWGLHTEKVISCLSKASTCAPLVNNARTMSALHTVSACSKMQWCGFQARECKRRHRVVVPSLHSRSRLNQLDDVEAPWPSDARAAAAAFRDPKCFPTASPNVPAHWRTLHTRAIPNLTALSRAIQQGPHRYTSDMHSSSTAWRKRTTSTWFLVASKTSGVVWCVMGVRDVRELVMFN